MVAETDNHSINSEGMEMTINHTNREMAIFLDNINGHHYENINVHHPYSHNPNNHLPLAIGKSLNTVFYLHKDRPNSANSYSLESNSSESNTESPGAIPSPSCSNDDTDADELQYGPGIVKKLRSKFLQYSLQTSRNNSYIDKTVLNGGKTITDQKATSSSPASTICTTTSTSSTLLTNKPIANIKPIQLETSEDRWKPLKKSTLPQESSESTTNKHEKSFPSMGVTTTNVIKDQSNQNINYNQSELPSRVTCNEKNKINSDNQVTSKGIDEVDGKPKESMFTSNNKDNQCTIDVSTTKLSRSYQLSPTAATPTPMAPVYNKSLATTGLTTKLSHSYQSLPPATTTATTTTAATATTKATPMAPVYNKSPTTTGLTTKLSHSYQSSPPATTATTTPKATPMTPVYNKSLATTGLTTKLSHSHQSSPPPSTTTTAKATPTTTTTAKATATTTTATPTAKATPMVSVTTKSPKTSGSTMIFDFRGKNVKANVAVHSPPFSVVRPAASKSDDNEDDFHYTGSTEIPQPSGITFKGENIIIDGGSLLVKRNKKLTLTFNDKATSTFEYPSEASFIDEPLSFSSISSTSSNSSIKSESISSTSSDESSVIQQQSNGSSLKNNTTLGSSFSGGLASYKPTFLSNESASFQLGVSRVIKEENDKNLKSTESEDEESGKFNMLKPAEPSETSSWSTSSTALDLLF